MNIFCLYILALASAALMPSMKKNMYDTACSGELSYMYAFGNSSCVDLPRSQLTGCKCPDRRFVQSYVDCIEQLVTDITEVPTSSQNNTYYDAFRSFLKTCKMYSIKDLEAFRANSSNLPIYDESKKVGVKAGHWPVDGAFALPRHEIENAYKGIKKDSASENLNKWFGTGLLGYWAAVIVLKGITYFSSNIFPVVSMKVANTRISRLYRRKLLATNVFLDSFGVNTSQALIILGFWVLVIVFTFCDLPTFYPNFKYQNRKAAMYGNLIGQRSGVLSLYLIPLLVLFGGRNNILQWLTGWPINPFLIFHKWIGRAVVFLLLVHAIGYSVSRASNSHYSDSWSKAYWSWGITGLAFGCFLVVQGVRFLRRMAYDVFVILHIIGAVLFIVAGYYHLLLLEEPYGLYYYYAVFAIWGLDRAMRLARVLTSGVRLNALVKLHDNMLIITIRKPRHWRLLGHPGKYTFIHFWQPSMFWQSHPFTIIVDPENDSNLKLICKVHRGATKRLADKILQHGAVSEISYGGEKMGYTEIDTPQMEVPVLLDGPYGHSYDLLEYDECVFVAGGSGITAPFSYIQSQLDNYPRNIQKMKLFWAVRDEEAAQKYFKAELAYLRSHSSRVEVIIASSKAGKRIKAEQVVQDAILNSHGPVAVMTCGPSKMCDAVRKSIAQSMDRTRNYVEYHEELFNW